MGRSENSASRRALSLVQARVLLLLSIGTVGLGWSIWPASGNAQSSEPPPQQVAAPSLSAPAQEVLLESLTTTFDYDSRGRRDPFVQSIDDRPVAPGAVHGPVLPHQKFELPKLQLVGIIWDVRKPKAMIVDPTGKTHIVGPNTRLGVKNGYIAVIREGEIVVVETVDQDGRLLSTAQVVKIKK